MILLYCLNTYRGDEKIKSFIWDLITPREHGGGDRVSKNHSGLSGPVPRGRKGRKSKGGGGGAAGGGGGGGGGGRGGGDAFGETIGWVSDDKYDMEMFLDKGYRKHLDRHGTKLLLRVRMLYYMQHEILAEVADSIGKPGVKAR